MIRRTRLGLGLGLLLAAAAVPLTAFAQSATQTWKYDADGNVIQTTTPNGRTIDYAVDALNRITSETVSSPQPGEIAAVAYQHDGNGNVTQIKETVNGAVRTATRTYDTFDRLNTAQDVHGKTLVYAYDAVGNRLSVTDTSDSNNPQAVTAWTYNALNQNDSVTADNAGTSISYFPSGLIHVLTRPDGSTSTTEYDAAGRIASVVHHSSANAEIAHERYDYDLDGNRWHQYESNGPLTNGEQTTTYSYDKADRLTDVQTPDRTTHYQLDPLGNRTEEQIKDSSNVLISDSTLAYNEREQLTSRSDSVTGLQVALTWDADGNTQTETDPSGTRTYTYDAHDRAIQITPAGAVPIAMDYQSDGLRIGKHQGAAETRYEYDENSLLAETNAIGNVLVRYHYSASQLLSRTETSAAPQTRHYLDDALNTPIATLNQGAIDSRTKYDAWGEITSQQGIGGAVTQANTDGTNAELLSTDNQAIGFTGYLKDSETGLYYAKARYYDPRIARFTTEDPEEGNAMQPPSLHRYLYAYANPTVYTDPTGKYGDAGHYYTTYYVALRLGIPDAEAQRLAFFSELPDKVSALDAIQVEKRAKLTGQKGAHLQRDLVQTELHALTKQFGPSETNTTAVAIQYAKGNPDAEGILIHRLGDTFAHRDDNENTYPTGTGHLRSGTTPDIIQRRPELYKEYVQTLIGVLGKNRDLTDQRIARLQSDVPSELLKAINSNSHIPREWEITPDAAKLSKNKILEAQAVEAIRNRIEEFSIARFGERYPFVDDTYAPEKSGPEPGRLPYDYDHTVADAIADYGRSKEHISENEVPSVKDVNKAIHATEHFLRYVEGKCAPVGCNGAVISTEDLVQPTSSVRNKSDDDDSK